MKNIEPLIVLCGLMYFGQLMSILLGSPGITTKKEVLISLIPFIWLKWVVDWFRTLD